MFAIVTIAGQQFKVEVGQKLYVHRLSAPEGEHVQFDQVLLLDKDGAVSVGRPTLDGVKVSARVLKAVKGDKVIVFRKKRRKGFKTRNGHRQSFSHIEVTDISSR